MFSIRPKRTPGTAPPATMLPGELAYSDGNKRLYLGRYDTTLPPAVIQADMVDYGPNIAALQEDVAAAELTLVAHESALDTLAADNSTQDAAINALEARPLTYGFTYDQQAEPTAPAVGATWRQRNNSGLIVGAWEWSGSLWLSNERYTPLYSGISASANTATSMSVYPKYPVLLTGYSVSFVQPFTPQDASNYWFFRHGGLGQAAWLTTINQSTTVPTFLQQILSSPVIISSPASNDNFASRVGTPGNLRQYQVLTHYKLIKP